MSAILVPGLDSSFNVPSLVQGQQARAAGVRAWGGYFGSQDGLGLATRWTREQFDVVRAAGLTPIGFCSGWDSAAWIRDTAAAWGIVPCVDVEYGIRVDGPWVMPWVQEALAGLYGSLSVHYQQGEPAGRGARFNIMAWYPGYDPAASWYDAIEWRPSGPCGWQWWGDHTEFGLSVDRSWYDQALIGHAPASVLFVPEGGGEGSMVQLTGADGRIHNVTIADSGTLDAQGYCGGPVHWSAIEGGPGGYEGWGGGDGELPGGGGWIVAGTLSASLWTWPGAPGGPRELLIVRGRGLGGYLLLKAVYTDNGAVQTEWTVISGIVPAVPGSMSGLVADEAVVRGWAVDEIERRLANG